MLKNNLPTNKKEKNIKLRQSILPFILLIFLLQNFTLVSQNTNIKSPALETLLQQIDKNYVPLQWNDGMNTMEKLSKTIPQVYFTFLGAAMNKQEYYINNNSIASQNFKNLNREILFQIPDLVDYRNSLNPNDYERINDNTLGDLYNDALVGIINENFNQAYKENTGKDLSQISMPSVLDQHAVGGTSFRKVAKKDKNEIKLLGEVAPKAEYSGNDQTQISPIEPIHTDNYSGPKQYEGFGCQCPQKAPSDDGNEDLSTATANRYLDCNQDPYDDTYVKCVYRGKGKGKGYYLSLQEPISNGKKHGKTYSWHEDTTNGHVYLKWDQNFFNGKENGIRKIWKLTVSDRRVYLETEEKYVNGKKHGIMVYYWENGTIKTRSKYIDGKFIENY